MTFAELLQYLHDAAGLDVLDGTPEQTLVKAQSNRHKNLLTGQIIAGMFLKTGLVSVDDPITRAQAVTAIGPIRLVFMKDDAPVEGFRLVEKIVEGIDSAFNDEALRLKSGSKSG